MIIIMIHRLSIIIIIDIIVFILIEAIILSQIGTGILGFGTATMFHGIVLGIMIDIMPVIGGDIIMTVLTIITEDIITVQNIERTNMPT
jgi:hypothetical protein